MYNATKDVYNDNPFPVQTDVGLNNRAATPHVSHIMYLLVLRAPLQERAHGADTNILGEGWRRP